MPLLTATTTGGAGGAEWRMFSGYLLLSFSVRIGMERSWHDVMLCFCERRDSWSVFVVTAHHGGYVTVISTWWNNSGEGSSGSWSRAYCWCDG